MEIKMIGIADMFNELFASLVLSLLELQLH